MKCIVQSAVSTQHVALWVWLYCRIVKPALDHLISTKNKPPIAASFFMRQLPCGCRPAAELDNKLDATG